MSLDPQRVAQAALAELVQVGFAPAEVLYLETGKSGVQILLEALSNAIIREIQVHGEVSVTLSQGLAAWMANGVPVPTDGGAALKTTLTAAAQGNAYDTSTGTMS